MDWKTHERRTHESLARRFQKRAVLRQVTLDSGRRPDHIVVSRRGNVRAVVESKRVRRLTHAHVDQVVDYGDELGGNVSLALSITPDTEISDGVWAHLADEGVDLLVTRRARRARRARQPRRTTGGEVLATGLVAYGLAKAAGAKDPALWGLGASFLAALLDER